MGSEDPREQLDRTVTRAGDGFAGRQDRSHAVADSAELDGTIGPPNWRAEQIREWLLLILRFAITRDARDQMGVFGKADELDSLGLQWRPAAPSFFRRTSSEVCTAIAALDDPKHAAILKRHLARIDDVRLRHALQAAVGLAGRQPRAAKISRRDLWTGLPRT